MKHPKQIMITFLVIFWTTSFMYAQQGSVAAGGDATGASGSISFSIGQIDYLMYSSELGSLNFGLQQPWTYTVPPTFEISDMTVVDNEILCFNATETVIVAGDGKHFIVEGGGHADIIAGINIVMRYGTSVEYGGSLHAYISNVFCEPPISLLAAFEEDFQPEQTVEPILTETFFSAYPNPTPGIFTLEMLDTPASSDLVVEIFTIMGERILLKELAGSKYHDFDLSEMARGIYLVRVIRGDEMGIEKVIRQ